MTINGTETPIVQESAGPDSSPTYRPAGWSISFLSWEDAAAAIQANRKYERKELEEYRKIVNDDGSLVTARDRLGILRDAMHALNVQSKLVAENERLRAYADHTYHCGVKSGGKCDCGYDAVL